MSSHVETPDVVENRVYHEEAIRPGAICRTFREEDGELTPTEWFLVASPPIESSNTSSEYIWIVWLTGDDRCQRDKYYLGHLGVKPPHRGVTEKHEIEIPERYIFPLGTGALGGLARRLIA